MKVIASLIGFFAAMSDASGDRLLLQTQQTP
eukprot:CAMPEP_0202684662 /NCGR_PEP_ID=MMETSP1385-20130828/209_1 /ASSEMBLY_ACC=CAM_ASM_000861 /TAXON_ID=933848 /ORGANISM="Elphidium margaritaceum" /LENGTH=30 /DNA_ID= /DNA_START= /DNA_END= /DNA_ORIENTATION=